MGQLEYIAVCQFICQKL